MIDLRTKIVRTMQAVRDDDLDGQDDFDFADAILAIPEIAEALERDQTRVNAKKFAATLGPSIRVRDPD